MVTADRKSSRYRQVRCPGLQPLESPLFLVGAPRSGTTLLYKALCLHPEVAYISNWNRRFTAVPAVAVLNRLGRRFPEQRMRAWFLDSSNAYVHSHKRSLAERMFPSPAEGEPIFKRCGIPDQPPFEATEKQLQSLRRAISSVARFGGGQRFVNKRIGNNQRIAILARAFPDARFLNIVRDGRAVANSLAHVDWWDDGLVWWYGGTPRDWAAEGGNPWDIAARHWLEEVRSIADGLAVVPPERVLEVRYEYVVESPLEALRSALNFAALESDDAWEAAVASLRMGRDAAWRRDLSEEALKRIEAIQADELVRHGYKLECP